MQTTTKIKKAEKSVWGVELQPGNVKVAMHGRPENGCGWHCAPIARYMQS
jgi:hypothetical protein